MTTLIVHFDKDGKEIATTSLVDGAVEAIRYGLKGAEHEAYVRAVRKQDADGLKALVGERQTLMTEAQAFALLVGKCKVDGAVRYEVKGAA